jgi:hypothetical protein
MNFFDGFGRFTCIIASQKKKDKKQVSLKTRPHDIAKFKTYFHYDHVGVSANTTLHCIVALNLIDTSIE